MYYKMDNANKSISVMAFNGSFSTEKVHTDGHFVFVKALFDIQNSFLCDFIKPMFSEHL